MDFYTILWVLGSMEVQLTFSRMVSQDVSNVYAPISWDCFLNGKKIEHTPSRTKVGLFFAFVSAK